MNPALVVERLMSIDYQHELHVVFQFVSPLNQTKLVTVSISERMYTLFTMTL